MPVALKSPIPKTAKRLDSNRLEPADRAAHDWYRFVLSFPPHLVRQYLDRFDLSEDSTVLDPFCGTGTTLVECKKLGYRSVGIEAHPMSHSQARQKSIGRRTLMILNRLLGRLLSGRLTALSYEREPLLKNEKHDGPK